VLKFKKEQKMKILIAYYSKTGGTEKLAKTLKKEFEVRGHSVDLEKVKPTKERSFWFWWCIRMIKGECEIQPPKIQDVSRYDAICIGGPNWTRLSLPVARYLREIKGLKYKNIGFFATTVLWPQLEWYILSAYLLDFTLSQAVEKKGGRIIDSILLSSFFKGRSLDSKYGKKIIKKFCDRIETPIPSLKSYFLEQKEIESTRLLIVIFTASLSFFLIFQMISSAIGAQIFTWSNFLCILAIGLLASFAILTMLAGRVRVSWAKYLAAISLLAITTAIILFLSPTYVIHGRSFFLSYVFIFIIISFFRDLKVVLFTGLITILNYFYLLFNYPHQKVIIPTIDLPLLFLTFLMFGLISQSLQRYYINLLDAQEDAEMARTTLEIKVEARTKELKELSENLEEQVKVRTKELQEKIEELERFHGLAVGRELKMISLKEEIEKLKKELEKYKK
jgi:hypothetical protein